ncbi:MAG TPA: aldo/keto reductase [Actinomycetes bacterium]|jgi:aryl-alcohol dehydrogenase-like predicted oxidoreductase|nr:aldo/keto reductase [Actinomycetes bacterium]
MEERRLGRSGLCVSRLALGTMTWGHDGDDEIARDQLVTFMESGGTLVDTAAGYGDGVAEEMLGMLLGHVASRDQVIVASRAGTGWPVGGPGGVDGPAGGAVDTSRRALLDTLDASLNRLGTDHIDLWLVHGFDPATPLSETLSALDFAVDTGRTRYVGVASCSGWQLAGAATWQCAVPGRAAVVAAAAEYSLLARGVEREVVPAAAHLGVGLLPWSPLGRGVLTGKYRHGVPADSRAASPELAPFVEAYFDPRSRRIVDAVATAADGLGVPALEVALAWVRDQPGVAAPVVGARTNAQLRAALASESLTLPDEIRQALDDVSRPPMGHPERPQ